MTAPPLVASNRFIDPGATRVYAVDAIADTASPSRGELDAGVDLTGEMAEMTGFTLSSEMYESRAVNSEFTTTEVGELRTDGVPAMVMWADLGGVDIRSLWSRGHQTHLVVLHGGDVAGHLMDVWPLEVAVVSKPFATAEAAFISVQFAVPADPVWGVEVP